MLPTMVLTSTATLVLASVLLLAIGHRVRFSSRIVGVLFAGVVTFGAAELLTRWLDLVPRYALVGGAVGFVVTVVIVLALPYWNPVGQIFLGAFLTGAGTYLAVAAYLTAAPGLSVAGRLASAILFALELMALVVAGYFAFEGMDTLCRTRSTRAIPPPDPAYRPRVALLVPAYNEPADMLLETVRSLEAIDYPHLEIMVVDNNTPDPETYRPVAEYCAGRPRVTFLHIEAEGFKAGALNVVQREHLDPGIEIIGVIDADYLVDPDYLNRVVGHFARPSVAFVQTPQDYREYEGDPYLTACYDAYKYFFVSSMPSRNERNSIIFAGTMGLIRRRVLDELGGWPEWCLTEDSETSLRMLKAGYEGVYVNESMGRGIMPLTFATFKSQRFRWCFGGIQIMRRHFRAMLPGRRTAANRLGLGQRLDYLFGTGLVWFNDLLYLGFTAVLLVTAFLILVGTGAPFRPLLGGLTLLPAALIASGLLRALWSLRLRSGIGWRRALLALVNWLSVSWTVAVASMQALIRSKAVFLRTPKERSGAAAPLVERLWTALRDAKVETVLAGLLWACGVAVALTGGATVLLLALFAWQGLVYASAPVMSWLNVRTVLTPQLERRRRSELRRERAAARLPYYAAGGVAVAAAAFIAFILGLGGSNPGSPPGGLEVPRTPDGGGILDPGGGPPTGPPGPSVGPSVGPSPGEPAPEPTSQPTGEPEPTQPPPPSEPTTTQPPPTEPAAPTTS
jgi:cellulose synthase/poly-beta-1,6-N-acetylglucosamine synthase-like glycosyltransferase